MPGWSSIVVVVTFLGGVQLIVLGVDVPDVLADHAEHDQLDAAEEGR